ncbi:hypothetical protein [Streptomyces sp. NBC_00887]|uniref:hypothetical protein n=1 Tax=Streptomyces sp. NBC_00887 TaxID=2975859 RepID=UPI0038668E6D
MNTITHTPGYGAAQRIAPVIEQYLGGQPPLRIRMWDGSETGPEDALTVQVRSPRALRRLLRQPGEPGLAEACITGDIDIADNLAAGLRATRHDRYTGLGATAAQDGHTPGEPVIAGPRPGSGR